MFSWQINLIQHAAHDIQKSYAMSFSNGTFDAHFDTLIKYNG